MGVLVLHNIFLQLLHISKILTTSLYFPSTHILSPYCIISSFVSLIQLTFLVLGHFTYHKFVFSNIYFSKHLLSGEPLRTQRNPSQVLPNCELTQLVRLFINPIGTPSTLVDDWWKKCDIFRYQFFYSSVLNGQLVICYQGLYNGVWKSYVTIGSSMVKVLCLD